MIEIMINGIYYSNRTHLPPPLKGGTTAAAFFFSPFRVFNNSHRKLPVVHRIC